jgi:hypothetical protein
MEKLIILYTLVIVVYSGAFASLTGAFTGSFIHFIV